MNILQNPWDHHGNLKKRLPETCAATDQGSGALIADLKRRGLLDETLVFVAGEMGRTPRINANGGRDHWPQVAGCILAGGGMQTGQVIGSTNRYAEVAQDRPVHYQQVFATLYRQLGLDVRHIKVPDFNGRPQYLVEHRDVISELI